MTVFLDLSGNEYIAQTNFKVTHGVNGELSISGEIISNDDVLHGIDRGWRLKFKDEYFYITYQKLQDEGRNTSVVFDAVHQFFWDFSKSPVYQKLSSTTSFRNCLEFIFKDSGYRYYVDQTIETASFTKEDFGMKDRLSLFNELVSSAGVEFNVSGKVVSIYKEVGTNLSTVVRKKLNLNELSITRNIGEFITYQRGFGKWKDENDHSKGRLEVEYESPLAKVYGRLEGQPVEDERYSIASSLLAVLKKNVDSSYSLSIELSMEDLTSAGYPNAQPHEGDYIMVVDEDKGFRERVRIVSYTSSYDARENLIEHQVTCNDIGAVKKQNAGYRNLVNQVKSTDANLANVQATANKALVSADGKSTNYYGTNFPVDVPKGTLKEGDLFYQQVGDKTIMHVWNGYGWVADPVVNDLGALDEHVRTEFEKVNAELIKQELDHNQAVTNLLAKAGAAESLAQEAKNIGNQAKTDAVNAINGALEAKQLAQAAGGQISQVQLAVDEANRQILQRVTKAEFNPITQRLSSAEATILTQAGQIEQRLTSTQVNNLVDSKGYQTASQVQSVVTQTADSLTRTISQVEAKIPTDVVTVKSFNETKDTVNAHTRTIGSVGESGSIMDNISQVTQTAAGLVSRVSLITDAQNLVYDPTRYSKYVARNSTSNLQKDNYSQYSAMRINHSGLTVDTYSGFKMPLRTSTFTAGEKLSIRAVIGIDVLPDSGGHIKFEIKNQGTIIAYFWLQPTRTGNNQVFTATTTVNVSTATVDEYGLDVLINRNGNVNITQISIIRGDQAPTSFVDSTTAQDVAISTQVTQLAGSYSIQNINSAGDLINGINLGANGTNRISGKATRITGDTIIDNAVIKSAMVDKLTTGNFESGSVTASIISAEAVTADKLKVDQAFFNKLTANEAYLSQMFAKNAFMTSVQAVTLSASKITSGILASINNTTNFNLQTGWIDMNEEAVGIRNLWPNYPIQYLVFGRGAINGKSASYTALMSNSKRAIGMDDGSAGIQIWNAMDNTTAVNLYGDEIAFMYNASDKSGVNLNTVTNVLSGIEDIRIKGKSLVAVLNDIFENFRNLDHDGNYQRGYYATW